MHEVGQWNLMDGTGFGVLRIKHDAVGLNIIPAQAR